MSKRMWTVLEMLRYTTEYLAGKEIEDARLNAEILLSDALGMRRLDLYLQFDRPLTEDEIAVFKPALLRRARREPLQYIAGHVDFRELRLRVDRRALIPRPETELLVDEVLAWCGDRAGLEALDIGTGTGAIALSLASEGDFQRIVATDLEPGTLELARENHALCTPGAPVDFRAGPLFEPVRGESFDLIVSNPPYVGEGEREALQPEVRDWEPGAALFAGADGLATLRPLIAGAPRHLRPGGLLALEIGATQAQAVTDLILHTGAFDAPRTVQDLAGRDRMILAALARSPAEPVEAAPTAHAREIQE